MATMNKSALIKAFSEKFEELVITLVDYFPDNKDVSLSRTAISAIKRSNPRLLMNLWSEHVFAKYGTQIAEGNLTYFLEKDYSTDLKDLVDNVAALEAIDRIRGPLKNLGGEKLKNVIVFLQSMNMICYNYLSLSLK